MLLRILICLALLAVCAPSLGLTVDDACILSPRVGYHRYQAPGPGDDPTTFSSPIVSYFRLEWPEGFVQTVESSSRVVSYLHETPDNMLQVLPEGGLNFGSFPVGGMPAAQTFTVRNAGRNRLTGTATAAAPFAVVAGGTYDLTTGQSATVTIRYTPSVAGSSARQVTFRVGAGVTVTRRVTGAAIPPMGGIGTIHGKVTVLGSGKAVPGARVQPFTSSIFGRSPLPYGQGRYTDNLGNYTLNVEPGTYDLEVVPGNGNGGALLDQGTVRLIVVPSGGSVRADAVLTQRPPDSDDPKEVPVVLVRGRGLDKGWGSGGSHYWQAMRDYLGDPARAGFKHVWDCNEPTSGVLNQAGQEGHFINGAQTIDENAKALLSYIRQKVEQCNTPPARINIVAHSMGGLITRKMLANLQTQCTNFPRVDKVVMLSTPNAGSVVADDTVEFYDLVCAALGKAANTFPRIRPLVAELEDKLDDEVMRVSTSDCRTKNFMNGQFSAQNPWPTDPGTSLYLVGGSYVPNLSDLVVLLGTADLGLEDLKNDILCALGTPIIPILSNCPYDLSNDGAVTIWSAQGIYHGWGGWGGLNPWAEKNCFPNATPALPFQDWHTNHRVVTTDPRVRAWVASVLAGTATASSGAPQLMPAPLNINAEPTTLTRVEVDTVSGTLAPSGHWEIVVPCDALSSFTLLLSYDAKAISFSLRNPAGVAILPSGFRPAAGVQYVALDTTATAGGIACYTVSVPTTGTWTAVLDAPSTASATVPWTLRVTGYGALDVAPTGGSLFHPAEEVLLSCFVGAWAGDGVTSVTGAVAQAVLTGPTGGLTTCTLLDDGAHWDGRMLDGQYAGLAQGLTLAGDYEVLYRVDGTDPYTGAAFRRVKRAALSISSGAGFIAGNLSHRSFDIDGDGRAERIGLECQVSVAGATTGTLTCDLVDPSGTVRISAAQEFVRTVAGTTAVTLLFDSGAIGGPGVFGPWKVENLQLFEQRDGRAYWMDTWPGDYSVGVSLAGPGTFGGLQMTLAPPEAVAAGAQWRIVDDPTTTTEPCWRGSATGVVGMTPGDYGIAFRPVTGWIAPTTRTVSVVGGETLATSATYVVRQFTVIFRTDGTPGASLTGATSQTVNYGADCQTVTANAPTGWHFVRWSDGVLTATRTDTNVTADLTVTAHFAINRYHLVYAAGANGSIDGVTSQTVNHGANGTTVTATPATGFHFVQWSDGVLTAARTDANVTADVSVTASFAINRYHLAYRAGANGSIDGATSQTVNHGASGATVTATPATGFHFVQWSDGVLTAARTDANVTADVSVTASFAINRYHLAYSAGANGSVAGATSQTLNHGASGTTVTAVAASGYRFVTWSDGNTSNPRRDLDVTASLSVTANFAINRYHLTYAAGTNGSVDGATSQTVNHGASGTTVTAVPTVGYRFTQWSDGILTAARTETNVTGGLSVTANFAVNQYAVAFQTDGAVGSTLTGTASQTVDYDTDCTAVTANAPVGWRFVMWMKTGVGAPYSFSQTLTVRNVLEDMTLTATFAPIPPPQPGTWTVF